MMGTNGTVVPTSLFFALQQLKNTLFACLKPSYVHDDIETLVVTVDDAITSLIYTYLHAASSSVPGFSVFRTGWRVTDLFGPIDSMALRKASQTTSTFFRPETGWLWIGLPSGRGYMLLVVSSSLGTTNTCHLHYLSVPHDIFCSWSNESDLSSVRKRLMWFVELSCVMKVSMFSRKTWRTRWVM